MKKIVLYTLLLLSFESYSQVKKNVPLEIIDLSSEVNVGYRKTENRKIDIIVIHSTYYVNADSFSIKGVMKQFRSYKVSPHYIIGRGGEIYLTVPEAYVAYHAGNSKLPDSDRTNLNTNSIGIEIINTPATPPTDEQYQSLVYLVQELKKRYPIEYVVRHSDIAPGRKTDPWMFAWEVFQNFIK